MLPELFSDRLEYLFQNMDDAVLITGRAGELLYANPAAQALFQMKTGSSGVIWDSIPYIGGNDELIQLFIDVILRKKQVRRTFVDYDPGTGERRRLQISLTYTPDEPPMFLIVISDLTRLEKVQSAFARYTSPGIAKFILSDPEGEKQGGQTRTVSILMSDLRGFSALSEAIPAAELIMVLNHYFEKMTAVIDKHHGTVIEFLGDGMFIVFGAPDDMPDHAREAVRCAVGMQNAMEAVNAWNREMGYPALEMGIGVNSGQVIVGNIGSRLRMKYGCIGQPVNLAGRIESYTVGGQIYISEFTKALIREPLDIGGEQTIFPKGAGREIRIFDIAGIGDEHAVSASRDSWNWKDLPSPVPFLFYRIDEKIVSPSPHEGKLLRVSMDGKEGSVAVEDTLFPLENLMLAFGEHRFYAKVMRTPPGGALIRFTSSPAPPALLFENEPHRSAGPDTPQDDIKSSES